MQKNVWALPHLIGEVRAVEGSRADKREEQGNDEEERRRVIIAKLLAPFDPAARQALAPALEALAGRGSLRA